MCKNRHVPEIPIIISESDIPKVHVGAGFTWVIAPSTRQHFKNEGFDGIKYDDMLNRYNLIKWEEFICLEKEF